MLETTKIALLVLGAAMILVAGCTSPGKRLEPSIAHQIQERAMDPRRC